MPTSDDSPSSLPRRVKDLTGQSFGFYTVIGLVRIDPEKNDAIWLCRCQCGRERTMVAGALRHTKHCQNCYGRSLQHDLRGQRFGLLVALNIMGKNKKGMLWRCLCDCGQTTVVLAYSLKSGHTRSCGCSTKRLRAKKECTHGMYSGLTRTLEWNGQTKTINEWSKQLGISVNNLCRRIGAGWPVDRVLGEPVERRNGYRKFKD